MSEHKEIEQLKIMPCYDLDVVYGEELALDWMDDWVEESTTKEQKKFLKKDLKAVFENAVKNFFDQPFPKDAFKSSVAHGDSHDTFWNALQEWSDFAEKDEDEDEDENEATFCKKFLDKYTQEVLDKVIEYWEEITLKNITMGRIQVNNLR